MAEINVSAINSRKEMFAGIHSGWRYIVKTASLVLLQMIWAGGHLCHSVSGPIPLLCLPGQPNSLISLSSLICLRPYWSFYGGWSLVPHPLMWVDCFALAKIPILPLLN
jgi:hypothetical protein